MDCSKLLLVLLEIFEGVVLDCDGEMLGFVLVCCFGYGCVIGLVVVFDVECVKGLIVYWINIYLDFFICIDVFELSGLLVWFDKLGLICVDYVMCMCKGELLVCDVGM